MDRAGLIEGGEGRTRIPVISYLIEHPRGRLLFDSGVHPELRQNPRDRIGFLADFYDVELPAGTSIAERLDDVESGAIDLAVCSHLHFDHCGGNAALGDVPVIVQRTEWDVATGDEGAALGYQRADFDTGQDVVLVDGTHDVFGDGTVVCLPSPGHTTGHQSLRVATSSGVFVLTADACDLHETLETSRLGIFAFDHDLQRSGLDAFRQMRADGAILRFGHDPDQVPDDDVQVLASA